MDKERSSVRAAGDVSLTMERVSNIGCSIGFGRVHGAPS